MTATWKKIWRNEYDHLFRDNVPLWYYSGFVPWVLENNRIREWQRRRYRIAFVLFVFQFPAYLFLSHLWAWRWFYLDLFN